MIRDPQQSLEIIPLLGSVLHQNRIEAACRAFGIQTIYHAAAYKHVPIVEVNPIEGVYNNIFGTYRTALAALCSGVETFVLISTDKAVRPTNVMGATKRFAEMILQSLSSLPPSSALEIMGDQAQSPKTRFCMVRFGNVLNSSGSVVPLFREQIRKGGPITLTHEDIIRFFMTIPEAAQLVIQAGAMAEGGDVFVLDMGNPVRVYDLAKRMIRLAGLELRNDASPEGDIEIKVTGLRPGEKLYEELLIDADASPTEHRMIRRAMEKLMSWRKMQDALVEFEEACQDSDFERVSVILQRMVEEYVVQSSNRDTVWRFAQAG
jgi:FlaA1/EpsC-like NDP-sugar epimerase